MKIKRTVTITVRLNEQEARTVVDMAEEYLENRRTLAVAVGSDEERGMRAATELADVFRR